MASPNDYWKRLQRESSKKLNKLADSRSGNKMNAKGQYYNGCYYHSTGEMNYAQKLDLLKKAKEIKDWKRQVKIELRVNGMLIANYFMDFQIEHNDGSIELVEYKGMRTTTFEIKWNLLHALKDELYPNGVTITLVNHKPKYNYLKQKQNGK